MVASAPARRGPEPGRGRDLGSGGRVAEMSAGADDDVRSTESGIPVERVYGEEDVAGLDLPERLGEPGDVPLHPWHPSHDVPRAGRGRCASTPASPRPRRPTRASATCWRRARAGSRPPSTCPPSSAWTPTTPWPPARSAGSASRSTRSRTWRRLLDGIPLDRVSTSMTINAPAAVLLLLYQLVAEESGVDPRGAPRHDPERRAQGVRGARQLHLPAGAVDAPDHRHLRLLRRRAAALEHDLDQRLPHPRGGLDGGAGGGLHAGQRHRLRRGGASRRAWTSTASAPGCRSSSTPTTTCWRRWPSSAPPARCGPTSCATASAPPSRAR